MLLHSAAVGCSGGVHCPVGGVLSCVPEYHKCDGLAECDNLEDEFDCGECIYSECLSLAPNQLLY